MNVFGPGKVTFDRIDGAIALYILLGVLWAQAYQLVSSIVPKAFYSASLHSSSLDRSIWIYFSFVTLTTAGYGDILPVAPQARSLTNLEALIGQLYKLSCLRDLCRCI
jgi:Ion channel